MKKLMTMVVAMTLITGSAFAGTLSWGSMDGDAFASAFVDNTPLPFSGTAYLFLLNGANDVVSWTGSAWNIPVGTTFLASSGAGTISATAGTWGSSGGDNVLDARMSATFGYQAVLVTATGHAALGDVTGGFWASTGPTLITGYDAIGGADATGALYWQQGSLAPGNWAPVPEPTSVALLAIGAAAIGLRRRIRK
jgi:hypothetical protein